VKDLNRKIFASIGAKVILDEKNLKYSVKTITYRNGRKEFEEKR
jgi:hypothetical protein